MNRDNVVLHTVVFDWPEQSRFARLLNVFRASCDALGVPLVVHTMAPPKRSFKGRGCDANHGKLSLWNEIVQSASDPLILVDADMVMRADPREMLGGVEHVGITWRLPGQHVPLNAGLVPVQPTKEARMLFDAWVKVDGEMFGNGSLHAAYRAKYEGMNQASLGMLLENGWDWVCERLECIHWNEVEPWDFWRDAALVHIKGRVRNSIFDGVPLYGAAESELVGWWHGLEAKLEMRGHLTKRDLAHERHETHEKKGWIT